MSLKTHVKKGDFVEVTAGNHIKKRGKILAVYPDKGRVKIENVAMVSKHKRVDRQKNTGGRVTEEGTVHISNVLVVDPSTDKPGRTKTVVTKDSDGKRKATRVFVKSGNPLA